MGLTPKTRRGKGENVITGGGFVYNEKTMNTYVKKAGMVAVCALAAVGAVVLIIVVWAASLFSVDSSAEALCDSLYLEQWELAKDEIAKSENVDQKCYLGGTALHAAVQGGNAEVVNLLLERGADPLASDYVGGTALHHAIVINDVDLEIVRLLLEHGADPVTKSGGVPLLHLAIIEDDVELVRLLLEHGADPKSGIDGSTGTAWDLTTNEEIIRLLQQAAK